jgi:hypothetical protein
MSPPFDAFDAYHASFFGALPNRSLLEVELAGKLNRAPGLGIAIGIHRLIDRVDGSKDRGPRAKISIRIREIRMIEGVVGFQPQLDVSAAVGPSDGQIFINLKIRIVEARPVEKVTLDVAERANRLL